MAVLHDDADMAAQLERTLSPVVAGGQGGNSGA
jgi:hypothetical protein